jgi:23S rRNA (pseudouridine1915-N3)-methyltransferase
MKIKIYTIDKKSKKELYTPLIEHYLKISKQFADVEVIDIFNNKIAKAQDTSPHLAQQEYARAFEEYFDGYTVVLDPNSKEIDSFEFAKIFEKGTKVTFFIGGAYGFNKDFIKKCNLSVSFGKITLSHKLVKVVLLEQVYRGLSIRNNHPYHK